MEVSSRRLAIVQHRHPPARGLLSLISLLSAFSLTGINRNQSEKSFNPTWVGALQFYIYISRRPTVGRHLTCLCMESKAICMESEAI